MRASRTALVTGAGKGIGAAIARRLGADGFTVGVADLDATAADASANAIGNGTAFSVSVDVSDPASVDRMVEEVIRRTGRIDVLVNNAGIAGPAAAIESYPRDDWKRVLGVNLDGVFYCTAAVVPHMKRHGYGRIVNIASIAGKEGNPKMPAYSASKAGVIGLTKSLGKELVGTGILVNCVTPAVIETEILRQLTEEAVAYMVSKIPMGRTGQPEEVAALVSWLSSDQCSFSTGAVFDISGGRATY